jgi:hypothetical protein
MVEKLSTFFEYAEKEMPYNFPENYLYRFKSYDYPMLITCKYCGNDFQAAPNSLFNSSYKSMCPHCDGKGKPSDAAEAALKQHQIDTNVAVAEQKVVKVEDGNPSPSSSVEPPIEVTTEAVPLHQNDEIPSETTPVAQEPEEIADIIEDTMLRFSTPLPPISELPTAQSGSIEVKTEETPTETKSVGEVENVVVAEEAKPQYNQAVTEDIPEEEIAGINKDVENGEDMRKTPQEIVAEDMGGEFTIEEGGDPNDTDDLTESEINAMLNPDEPPGPLENEAERPFPFTITDDSTQTDNTLSDAEIVALTNKKKDEYPLDYSPTDIPAQSHDFANPPIQNREYEVEDKEEGFTEDDIESVKEIIEDLNDIPAEKVPWIDDGVQVNENNQKDLQIDIIKVSQENNVSCPGNNEYNTILSNAMGTRDEQDDAIDADICD